MIVSKIALNISAVLLFTLTYPLSANTLYMPEGYINGSIDEFVGVLNTTNATAQGKVTIYYEDGNTLAFDVAFPPKQRSGFSIKDQGVNWDMGYSTVIETDQEITATLIHYDNGRALGANFTPTLSKEWSIAEGVISQTSFDYLSIYNPNNAEVVVNLSIPRTTYFWYMNEDNLSFRIKGKRRFSLALHDYLRNNIQDVLLAQGVSYGVLLKADQPVVASFSHFDDNLGDGTLTMLHSSLHGNSHGFVAEGWMPDKNGNEWINFINPHNYTVALKIIAHYNNGISQELSIPGIYLGNFYEKNRVGFELYNVVTHNLGYALEYQATVSKNNNWDTTNSTNNSTSVNPFFPSENTIPPAGTAVPVIANFVHFDLAGLNGTQFTGEAKKHWEFAEGYRSFEKGKVKEYLLIFNPNNTKTTATVTLFYDDGKDPTTIKLEIEPNVKNWISLHDDPRIRDRKENGGIWYGIMINADMNVVPYFTHYDFGASFALEG